MDDREQWRKEFAEAMAEHVKPQAETESLDILRMLAAEPASGMHELAPGVWHVERGLGGESAL
ncbi:MAG TPA: hypothetical protein VGL98_06200 [Gammaproteobacteria bacterium]